MLGEFTCDQDVFVHLFSNKSVSTEFLSTQMRTSLANLFQPSLWKCHGRR